MPAAILSPAAARVNRPVRLSSLSSPSDTKTLIETAVKRFQAEVPALQQLKLVVGLELRGRGDMQLYRVEVPGPKVSKDIPSDAKVTLTVSRSHFNELATKGTVKNWREAFVPRYLELLASGGSRSPEELGSIVGIDLADPGFWDAGLALVEEQLRAAEELAEKR